MSTKLNTVAGGTAIALATNKLFVAPFNASHTTLTVQSQQTKTISAYRTDSAT